MQAGGNQPGNVGHIDHENRADLLSDFGDFVKPNFPRVGRGASHNEFGRTVAGDPRHLVIINISVGADAVGNEMVGFARAVDR